MMIDQTERRFRRIGSLIYEVSMHPNTSEPWETTSKRNKIFMTAAVDSCINDYKNDEDFSPDRCLGIISQAALGQLNPKMVMEVIAERWNSKDE